MESGRGSVMGSGSPKNSLRKTSQEKKDDSRNRVGAAAWDGTRSQTGYYEKAKP